MVVLLFIQKQFSITIKYVSTFNWLGNARWNMQIYVCFCKTCICLKNLENIQISVNMINRLDITDEYSVKCDFILNTVTFIDAALNISLRKLWKCNVLWFYLFGQGVPNETKGTINLKINVSYVTKLLKHSLLAISGVFNHTLWRICYIGKWLALKHRVVWYFRKIKLPSNFMNNMLKQVITLSH